MFYRQFSKIGLYSFLRFITMAEPHDQLINYLSLRLPIKLTPMEETISL